MTLGRRGRAATAQSARGHASLAAAADSAAAAIRRRRIRRRWRRRIRGGGGGGFRGGGGGGGGGGAAAAADAAPTSRSSTTSRLLGHLDNGLGFYRFSYNGSDKAYVGVMAQEVQVVMPDAVTRDRDGICGCATTCWG